MMPEDQETVTDSTQDGDALDVTPKPEPQERTFTQSEMDATIRDRLARERQKYADYKDLQDKAAKLQEIEDANKSELEKMQERLRELETTAKQAAAENQRLKLQAHVATIAGELGAVDPHDANFMIATQAIDPDGDGVEKDIRKTLESLKAAKPYLFGQRSSALESFNPADPAGKGTQETDAERRARLYSRGGSVFSPDVIEKTGGGVLFSPGWNADEGEGGGE
jgi:hypothetical protein